MMGDYIYPECPNCENKARRHRGVSFMQVRSQPFEWYCHECKMIHKGNFYPDDSGVSWHESREATLLERVKQYLFR